MALYVLQPGLNPLGQFDCKDGDVTSVVGGLIGTWDSVVRTEASDEGTFDIFDGYTSQNVHTGSNTAYRPYIRIANTAGDNNKAMFLLDDGISGYGTLFGSVLSMFSPTGTAIGPTTALASGKVTCWDKAGLYAATFEACYSNINVTQGALQAGQDTPAPGDLLYRHQSTGKICRYATATAATSNVIGVYVEHANSASLVTTPAKLVGATEVFDRIVFNYVGAFGNFVTA